MATEVRKPTEREVGAGGEIFEPEQGIRVRKSGGVEFAPPLSESEIEVRRSEITAQIQHQKSIVARAREESVAASRQANEQEILAREALEFKEFNRGRQQEAAADARELMLEVTSLVEREKELERNRAAAHHLAVEKERERVEAKTAEVMAREEANEAEKREQYHKNLIRNCQALTLKYQLEEQQAKLKLESLQYTLQCGEFRPTAAASKATIIVEVEPRSLPEARQFDTSQVETKIAAAEMLEEGIPTLTDTRTIEEMVIAERTSKARSSHTSSTVYSTQRGSLKAEETYGDVECEKAKAEMSDSQHSMVGEHGASTGGNPPVVASASEIKVLSDIKPTHYGSTHPQGSFGSESSTTSTGYSGSQPSLSSIASGEHSTISPIASSEAHLPHGAPGPSQPTYSATSQQTVAQQAPTVVESGSGETGDAKKKAKSGGFFKKFAKSTKPHEQH